MKRALAIWSNVAALVIGGAPLIAAYAAASPWEQEALGFAVALGFGNALIQLGLATFGWNGKGPHNGGPWRNGRRRR